MKSVVDNERVMVIWDQASTPYICHNELLIRLVRRREWAEVAGKYPDPNQFGGI